MKILRGSLKETVYNWPKDVHHEQSSAPLEVKKETIYGENAVTYISDKIGLHRISNPDPKNSVVSLHLYTPPNAAKYGCHIFDEKTGSQSHASQCLFYSEMGRTTRT
ncbi:hypothetical protein LTR28_009593 [Elasticomyces elasticus]|nr:hypothetical protein LTR28_009593 [Elasticomyces elasticus]